MTLRYIDVTQNDLQREFHTARMKLANNDGMFPLPSVPDSETPTADIPTITRAQAATRHLLEMYRRQLDDGTVRRQSERLANRLIKVAGELDQLAGPSK